MEKEKFATMVHYTNTRTKSGNWSTVKHDVSTQEITKEMYDNIINNPWKGDRASREYTSKGYLVTRLTTSNPHADERSVREFTIH